jgi:hypothetical protein
LILLSLGALAVYQTFVTELFLHQMLGDLVAYGLWQVAGEDCDEAHC